METGPHHDHCGSSVWCGTLVHILGRLVNLNWLVGCPRGHGIATAMPARHFSNSYRCNFGVVVLGVPTLFSNSPLLPSLRSCNYAKPGFMRRCQLGRPAKPKDWEVIKKMASSSRSRLLDCVAYAVFFLSLFVYFKD